MATGQNKFSANPMFTPTTVGHGLPPPREILDWFEFAKLYNYWITGFKWVPSKDFVNINLLPMISFGGFQSQYEHYVAFPDDGVVIAPRSRVLRYDKDDDGIAVATTTVSLGYDEDINGVVVPEGVTYQLWEYKTSNLCLQLMKYLKQFPRNALTATYRCTDGEASFLSTMVVISSSKVFGGSIDQQKKMVRTRADSFARITGHYECMANNLENFMDLESLSNIKESMVSYPKLTVAMFKTVLQSYTELARSRLLLDTHQLTLFNLILIFVSRPSKSAAHSHPRVMEEYHKWFQTLHRLKWIFGDDWVYCELKWSQCIETATENWPTLATCGLFLAMFLANIKSWAQLTNSKINKYFNACELMEANSKEPTIHFTANESDIFTAERLLRILETNRLEVNVDKLFDEVDQALLKSYGPVATASGV